MKLDRDKIVEAAFSLLDDEGLGGLSLRKLAARLDVQAPAIYWYIPTKAALLGLMSVQLTGEARAAAAAAPDWQSWLITFGHALHDAFLAHRDSARLYAEVVPAGHDAAQTGDMLAEPLIKLGLARDQAIACQASVISLTLGWALFEQASAMQEFLSGMMSMRQNFEQGLAALVSGFAANGA
jgi:TetR/AcrR family tetracycline transcriptional repressor